MNNRTFNRKRSNFPQCKWSALLVTIFLITLSLLGSKAQSIEWNIGAAGGVTTIRSPGLDLMNQRLGNSLRLIQVEQHDLVDSMSLWGGLTSDENTWQLEVGMSYFSEKLSGKPRFLDDISLVSSFQGYTSHFRAGFRVLPITKFHSRSDVDTLWNGFQVFFLIGWGTLFFQHDYRYYLPQQGTEINYQIQSFHSLASISLRLSYFIMPAMDLIVDVSVMQANSGKIATNIRSLMIQGQDQRYRADLLDLDAAGQKPVSLTSVTTGIRLIISGR